MNGSSLKTQQKSLLTVILVIGFTGFACGGAVIFTTFSVLGFHWTGNGIQAVSVSGSPTPLVLQRMRHELMLTAKTISHSAGLRLVENQVGGCADVAVYELGNNRELVLVNACNEASISIR